jgi:ribosomal protein L25 (general stress protein Ctc)
LSKFSDVLIAYPVEPSTSLQVFAKFIVGKSLLQTMKAGFILYGAGIAQEPEFEEEIAGSYGISVHGFDCTIPANTVLKNNVSFHHWCIGSNPSVLSLNANPNSVADSVGRENTFENNVYSQRSQNKTFLFKTLSETKLLLKHSHIHILKMDIEGYEWKILQDHIINHPKSDDLPDQILVELHTNGANKEAVPSHLTEGKMRQQVNELVLGLWKRGYRCVFKLVNPVDRHCADFTFLRVFKD